MFLTLRLPPVAMSGWKMTASSKKKKKKKLNQLNIEKLFMLLRKHRANKNKKISMSLYLAYY